jgi:trk system potassium uptake protein
MRSTLAVLLANMGFVLQVSGIFILIPIIASFILGETSATLALFIAATSFLVLGFFTNSLCEKKEMTFKQSCALIVLVFVILSIIGAIPYLYINFSGANIFQRITDSIFESVSGFTTTGFSVIPDLTVLPQSIILYRSLTQFIGGLGIVIVLLAFFYPEAKLREFAKSMGISKKNHKIKKTFMLIISIYCAFTILMIIIGYLFGYHDLIGLGSLVFSAISTGGFSPVNDLTSLIHQSPFDFILPISMIFGATNFLIFAKLYGKKFKEFLNSEITVFLIIAAISTVLLITFFGFPSYDAGFQVISALSTTGFSYLSIGSLNDSLKLFLVILMFIGGCAFSTAGGIKIYRLLLLIKSVRKTVTYTITGKDNKIKLFGREYANAEVIQAATLVFLMAAVIFVSSFIVSYYGYKPINAVFDCTSAIATTGLSTGVVGPGLSLGLKWLFMFLMILGRVEIIAFLVIFSRAKERHVNNHSCREKNSSAIEIP